MRCGQQSCAQYDNSMTISVSKRKEMETDNNSKLNFEIISKTSNLAHFESWNAQTSEETIRYSCRGICNCTIFNALSNAH